MTVRILLWSVIFVMSTVEGVPASRADVKAVPMSEYESMFRRTTGWIGADGIFSVPLDKDTVLWLFSDTFVGKVRDNRRVDWTMINNSVGVQHLRKRNVEFFYKAGEDGKPESLVTPDDGRGYFWLFDGAAAGKSLYIFLLQVEHAAGSPDFGFRSIGMSLGRVDNPNDPPDKWKVTQRKLPFCRFGPDGDVLFGCSVLKDGPYVYIYGLDSSRTREDGVRMSAMILARAPMDKLDDFDSWRFYSKGKWVGDFAERELLCDGLSTEYSICYLPGLKQYAAVYTAGGIFGEIVMRLSPKPEGPWGEPVAVYDCPDRKWHEKTYSYAAKAHPELSESPDELVITYATNSTHFPDVIEDARLYWPRFVRLQLANTTRRKD